MLQDISLFDTSDHDSKHLIYSVQNKKSSGENEGRNAWFSHTRVRMSEIEDVLSDIRNSQKVRRRREDKKIMNEKKTAKGVKKNVIEQHTKHQHYKQCLFNREIRMSTMNQIRSYGHQLYNISINKLGIPPFDDKRYILDDGISSLAYGHWRI